MSPASPRRAPSLEGALTAGEVAATVASIAACQEPDGAIPWYPGGRTDPWDHVECAMALDAGGRHREAEAAYAWLVATQRADGSWASSYRNGRVVDATAQTHHAAYVAVGVWHHLLATGDERFLNAMWPTVRRALDWVAGMAGPSGQLWWARNPAGRIDRTALTTATSSAHHGLLAGLALADRLGVTAPHWERTAAGVEHALDTHPELFADPGGYSMDWYYPVLGGGLDGPRGWSRLVAGWEEFVVPGLGIRCVADRPWVTGAETCELALTLDACGRPALAAELVVTMQHLRHDDGAYWTGLVVDDGVHWPVERTTWTAAAMVLAVDALAAAGPQSGVFRTRQVGATPGAGRGGTLSAAAGCPICAAAAASRTPLAQ